MADIVSIDKLNSFHGASSKVTIDGIRTDNLPITKLTPNPVLYNSCTSEKILNFRWITKVGLIGSVRGMMEVIH